MHARGGEKKREIEEIVRIHNHRAGGWLEVRGKREEDDNDLQFPDLEQLAVCGDGFHLLGSLGEEADMMEEWGARRAHFSERSPRTTENGGEIATQPFFPQSHYITVPSGPTQRTSAKSPLSLEISRQELDTSLRDTENPLPSGDTHQALLGTLSGLSTHSRLVCGRLPS